MASPRPRPPATNTGTSRRCGRTSCARTDSDTGPIWPPASEPSMTMASAPERTRRFASDNAGENAISLEPLSLTARTAGPGGIPPASTICPTPASSVTRIRSFSSGCIVIRFTPNGLSVRARVPAICSANCAGFIAPQAMTPKPPALEMAETRCCSLTQLMAPPRIAYGQPRNAVPRDHKRSSRERAAIRGSDDIEAVGGMQRTNGQFGIFGRDQHADLDLTGGNHLDVDRLVRQSAEHGVGDAGMAAHADPDDADLGNVRIFQQFGVIDLRLDAGQGGTRARQVGLADREG